MIPFTAIATAALLVLSPLTTPAADPGDGALRAAVEAMKASARGPFARIRWFCADGTILPPEPYACREHGGGSQHGAWTDRVKTMRDQGFHIANVYADLDVQALLARPDAADVIGQMLVERYLINVDQGWILRRARFYRGALQEEGERHGARRLLLALLGDESWLEHRQAVLRGAARLLRHGPETASIGDMRQLAFSVAARDEGFTELRNKIHGHPDAGDVERVREYAATHRDPAVAADLERLVAVLEDIYAAVPVARTLGRLAADLEGEGHLARTLAAAARRLDQATDPARRLAISAEVLAVLRDHLAAPARAATRLELLAASLALEDEHFTAATELRQDLDTADRRERLAWLAAGIDAGYGTGLFTPRQRRALLDILETLAADEVSLARYKAALDDLALAPGWAAQTLRFHFGAAEETLARIEPLAALFSQDVLRGGPLLFFSQVMNGLLMDANRLAGMRHRFLGQDIGSGLRGLNPGLARGTLYRAEAASGGSFDSDGIYVLPETTAELPPVAGIITAGEGNPLSHVQLLARNLGIPNVAADAALVARLEPLAGRRVVLAVSPRGVIRLGADDEPTGTGSAASDHDVVIRPDLEKLDLENRNLMPLSQLRATDSGRTVGPKAAKLGELRHHFPEAVADGLAIPFGVFRALLDQPMETGGPSVFEWMVDQYRQLETLPAASAQRQARTEALRKRLHARIAGAEPGPAFAARLKESMARVFGPDGSYGVFVRSDTNVEDLPGFTGAGLNLTVPNVVGVDAVLAAIPRVWASPFTARAFAWRQRHMEAPEHVYPAVLLLRSVAADKSGVMVTRDVDSGSPDWLTVAVNQGVGGAVDGQAAESLRIHVHSGEVRLMAAATARERRLIDAAGGVTRERVAGIEPVLEPDEIRQLIAFSRSLPQRFPAIVDDEGHAAPADIEFGFKDGQLRLFQIRPFLESRGTRRSALLKALDARIKDLDAITVDMTAAPGGTP
ncbi:MAG: PEP/pyruvate-binding domain-containing protein [Gammaproteobacteria bacterium]|nr:PEP/pyruvate-binding domain-containing protein [Gammaproteobacteria bacterium]